MNSDMNSLLASGAVMTIFFIALVVFLLPAIFYLLTLQRVLSKCAPGARTMEPGMVWLCIVPLVNLVFQFFVVLAIANSLRNEFNRRGMAVADPTPGQQLGMAMCISGCCCIIPIVNFLAGLAYLVLWIMYWVKVAGYSKMLDTQPQPMPASAM